MKAIADAVHNIGGLLVLDCIASGGIWVDIKGVGVDVLISASQKGWSASPCSGLVMLSKAAKAAVKASTSSSFACDLKKRLEIMEAYKRAAMRTMPPCQPMRCAAPQRRAGNRSDGFREGEGGATCARRSRAPTFAQRGFVSVAAEGFGAPGVVVCYTDDPGIKSGAKFAAVGLQAAAGVPLMCDEPADFQTFRIGLFGLDKLADIDRTVGNLESALDKVLGAANVR